MTCGHNTFLRLPKPGARHIGGLLPAGAIAVESPGDGAVPPLWPEEERALGQAVARRRREFAVARACAHIALDRLGAPPQPLLPGRCREPCWPAGVVGSITHCAGYHAAAVAWRRMLPAIGIDAEVHAALPAGVDEVVMTAEERALFPGTGGAHWDCVVFSAKESAFKAWFALTACWLDPTGATVRVDRIRSLFTVAVTPQPGLPPDAPMRFVGRFAIVDGIVLTVAVPAPQVHEDLVSEF